MSSDLFREFAGLDGNSWGHVKSQGTNQDSSLEEDEFGEFEEPEKEGSRMSSKTLTGTLQPPHDAVPEPPANVYRSSETAHSNVDSEQESKGDGWGEFNDCSMLSDSDRQIAKHAATNGQPQDIAEVRADNDTIDNPEAWELQSIEQSPIKPAKPALHSTPKPALSISKAINLISGPPPTNIPPPSVLLSLCTRIIQTMATDVRSVTKADYPSSSAHAPLDQQTIDRAQRIISDLRSAGRVMAGRKLRWKRDNILSQSVKIGSAGKPGGMKLTSVDKTESRREDQEAAEVLRLWKQGIGPLRSNIATFNTYLPTNGLLVPELGESMPVRLVKPDEGAVTAPKSCFLCGIKRDERVPKVDVNVEDSFGEWWVEHWGHVDCSEFWNQHKDSLAQR